MEEMKKSLEDFMGEIDSPYLKSDEDAEAILVRMNKRNRAKEAVQREADAWHAKVNVWLAAKISSIDNANASDEAKLQVYAEDRLKNSKRKSVSLPSGKFGFRKGQPKIEHQDDVLLQYAKEANQKYVKVKESLDWSGLKKSCTIDGTRMVDANGEILPGVTVMEQEPKFYVDAKGDEK